MSNATARALLALAASGALAGDGLRTFGQTAHRLSEAAPELMPPRRAVVWNKPHQGKRERERRMKRMRAQQLNTNPKGESP